MVRSSYNVQRLTAPSMDTNLSPDELAAWEDADSMILPPLEDRDAADPESVALEQAKERQNPYARVAEAYKRKAEYEASRPKLGDHKPNKWQRLAAAAANFGAGYVNMGGRTRVDSGALNTLNNELLRPGYTRAMQDWKDQGAGVDAEVEGTRAQAQIDMASQRAETDRQRAEAYARSQEAIAAERQARMNRPTSKYINTAKGAFNTETGQYVETPKDPGPVKETPAEARIRRREEASAMKHLTDEQRETYELTGKIPAKPRPSGGKGGGGGKPRVGTPGQFRGVEKEKQVALSKAEAAYRKIANDPSIGDTEKAAALAELEAEKARIMDAYDAGVETLGGSVLPRGGGKKSKTPPAGAKTATNPKTGEKVWYDDKAKQWVPL